MNVTALSTLSPKSETKERQRSKSSTAECFLAEDWRSVGSDADLNNGGPQESRLKEYPCPVHAQIQNHSLLCSSLLPMTRALVMVVVEEMVVVVKVVVGMCSE